MTSRGLEADTTLTIIKFNEPLTIQPPAADTVYTG